MIRDRETYLKYLEADRCNLRVADSLRNRLLHDVWRYQRCLRKAEYLLNCGQGPWGKVRYLWARRNLKRAGLKIGVSLPMNAFGPGLSIAHPGTIVVNSNARVGANCRLHVCVNIGASGGKPEAPQIGNNVYIGPGAKIFGGIDIADGVAIGANAVVNRSVETSNVTAAGVPAKVISDQGSSAAGWNPANQWLDQEEVGA